MEKLLKVCLVAMFFVQFIIYAKPEENLKFTSEPRDRFNCYGTFCEGLSTYPKDYIQQKILADRAKYEHFFDNEIPEQSAVTNYDEKEASPCASKSLVMYPHQAKNKAGDWAIIVNNGQITQGVRVELCQNTNQGCSLGQAFPGLFQSKCTQMYSFQYLLAINANGGIYADEFPVPSHCQCEILSEKVNSLILQKKN